MPVGGLETTSGRAPQRPSAFVVPRSVPYLVGLVVATTHLPNALRSLPYVAAKPTAFAFSASLQVFAAAVVAFACAATDEETARETHLP
jgi:hypothetical protein